MNLPINPLPEMFRRADELSADLRKPFPASRKIHVEGPGGIRVPMREISLTPTHTASGDEPNPPVNFTML